MGLKHLDLSWNGFGNEGALALGEALKFNNTLVHLNLNNNRITNEGVGMLCRGLEHNDTLQILQVGQEYFNAVTSHKFQTESIFVFCSSPPVAGLQLCNSRGRAGAANRGKESVSNCFRGDRHLCESVGLFFVLLSSFCVFFCLLIVAAIFGQAECPCQ